MKEFLLTIVAPNKRQLSAADEAKCIVDYGKWAKSLGEAHILGRRLSLSEGAMLPKKDSIITDGPFIEAKELIAGIVVIQAKDMEEASSIAGTCPLNSYFHLFIKESQ